MFVFAWILWSIYTLYLVVSTIFLIVSIVRERTFIIALNYLISIAMYVFLNIYLFAR